MFQFVYISQGAAPIHPPASSAATHHSCDNAEVRFFRECFHFSYFLFLKVVPAASPVKQSVAKKPANKRCSSKVDIIDYNFKWVVAASQNSHCKEGGFLTMPIFLHAHVPHGFQRILMLKYFLKNTPVLGKILMHIFALVHFCKMLIQNRG